MLAFLVLIVISCNSTESLRFITGSNLFVKRQFTVMFSVLLGYFVCPSKKVFFLFHKNPPP